MSNTAPDLTSFFHPQSIAIIGASADPSKIGHIVVRNLQDSDYPGTLYPVNPKGGAVRGLTVWPDYSSLPQVPDLAIIAIPAALILPVVEQIANKGTQNVLIFSAGFKESGEEGEALEAQLKALAHEKQLNILGPNCLGFVDTTVPLNATFGAVAQISGNLRFISQSGAIATSIFDWAAYTGIGFTQFVTLGNKTVLSETEILQHWLNTTVVPKPKRGWSPYQPVGMYLESIDQGIRFLEITKKISTNHPIFVLKPGKSAAAQKAMQSHTGALAGEDAVLAAAFNQAGIVRCEGIEDFFDLARAFAWEQPPKGPRIAIISNAGGPAVISSDWISQEGLELAPIDAKTHRKLLRYLPRAASIVNPIDVLGDALADRYARALDAVLTQPTVDAVLVLLTPQVMTQIRETAEAIGRLSAQYHKPVICSFMGGQLIAGGETVLNHYQLPSFRFPERAIKALGAMWRWEKWKQKQKAKNKKQNGEKNVEPRTSNIGKETPGSTFQVQNTITGSDLKKMQMILTNVKQEGRTNLTGLEMDKVLKDMGIQTPRSAMVRDFDQAQLLAQEWGYPVVLKLSAAQLLHKKEAGGVMTGIKSTEQLWDAFETMKQRIGRLPRAVQRETEIQLQKQVGPGVEVLVGIKRDPSFGNVLMVGMGGALVELVADRNLAVLPVSRAEIISLVKHAKVFKLLQGYRGEKASAVKQLIDLIESLVQTVEAKPVFAQIEINPVIVTRTHAWAVDGKGILGKNSESRIQKSE